MLTHLRGGRNYRSPVRTACTAREAQSSDSISKNDLRFYRKFKRVTKTFAALIALCSCPLEAIAGPWAEVAPHGETRSNIALVSAAGAIGPLISQWPIAWNLVTAPSQNSAMNSEYVQVSASALRDRKRASTKSQELKTALAVEVTTSTSVVRGFDALSRHTVQTQLSLEYLTGRTAFRLDLNAHSKNAHERKSLSLEGTYIAQRVDDFALYAGYVEHWWGPGWFSALGLSNNAVPMPQIGISRISSDPFKIFGLSWLGPWRGEFLIGLLDGPRQVSDTVFVASRISFSPFRHLEIGLSRMTEMCGRGVACSPLDYFSLRNDETIVNNSNDQGTIDIRYSRGFKNWTYEVYAQAMNEDTNPFVHSATSHLIGASLWAPIDAGIGRITVEYSDSVASENLFGGGVLHGAAYNNTTYSDGMRYRGRTLGFSLDSDSTLLSIALHLAGRKEHSISLAYHHAQINTKENRHPNILSSVPVAINVGEAKLRWPLTFGRHSTWFVIAGRVEDNQIPPMAGFRPAIELAISTQL